MSALMNIYEAAIDKHRYERTTKRNSKLAKKAHIIPNWDNDNPEASKLLKWASGTVPGKTVDPMEVRLEHSSMPESEKRKKKK